MINNDQVKFFWEHGYLHIPQVFTPEETDELTSELDWLIDKWANITPGWSGPWRRKYMDAETEKKSKLIAMHDLSFYSEAWMKAVTNPGLCDAMAALLGPRAELHHSTMHVKPPETGHPFPMHQDWAFYKHRDGRYVDLLVHLDDTCHENGEIRFLDGSHKGGALEHITRNPDGTTCTPHLPTGWKILSLSPPNEAMSYVLASMPSTDPTSTKQTRTVVSCGSDTAILRTSSLKARVWEDRVDGSRQSQTGDSSGVVRQHGT